MMAPMATLRIAHTAELDTADLAAAEALLNEVFEEELDGSDWEHCLGGMHVLLRAEDRLLGHASVVQRRLLHGGRAVRTGYVEGVAVRRDERGHGHGATLLAAAERLVRGGYELGALSSTETALDFYTSRGWHRWQGTTWALTPAGVVRTPEDDDAVFVLPGAAHLDLAGELTCDWRDGDVW
jgi:aminoglycoside 2'-N-acetyltransferase I